ncbi:MAG: hypothetical protein BalsKO_22090 [Balneolaceae bacterium]
MKILLTVAFLFIFQLYMLCIAQEPDYLILNDNQICTSKNSFKECSELTEVQKLFIKNAVTVLPKSTAEKDLITPPFEWGKEASEEARGKLTHSTSYDLGWVSVVQLNNLLPNHKYMLTLNGNPELDGNELLPKPVPGLEEERYWDIVEIETDTIGHFEKKIAVQLLPGEYHVRFYVKDQDDFKIVLYHDYFRFTATE